MSDFKNLSSLQADHPLLNEISESVSLREGASGVASFLRAVVQHNGAALKQIAWEVGLPVPVATAVRRELEARGYLVRKGGVNLTEQGRHFAEEVLDIQASTVTQCPTCNGSGLKELDPELIKKLQVLLVDAPNVRVELDQAPCTAETALHRAELMHKAGALEGRNILLLGDDDSLSLAIPLYLAHMGRNRSVNNITVLELDPGRIGFLKQKCEEVGAAVTIVQHDLRDPLPANLKGQFDTFQTDPPYTIEGAELFLTRAAEALQPGPGALGFLSYSQPASVEQIKLQHAIHSLGFAILSVRRDFNTYEGASILGSTGQMIELEGLFAQVPEQTDRYNGEMYTADKSTRRRGYRCKGCRKTVTLGEDGTPNTIEELKASGCHSCGARVFVRWKPGMTRRSRR